LDLEVSHGDLELVQLRHNLQQAHTRDAGEDSAVQGWSDKLLLTILIDHEAEEIHGANFSHVIVQQPQHLVTAVLLKTIALSPDRRCVVPSDFLVTEAVGPGSNHTRVTEEFDRDETSWVVRSHRAQNNEGLRFGDSRETQLIIHADRSWSDVERVEWLVGDPVLLELDQASAGLKHLEAIKSWDAQLQVRLVHPLEVLIASENNDFVIDGPVGFGTFKALDGVV